MAKRLPGGQIFFCWFIRNNGYVMQQMKKYFECRSWYIFSKGFKYLTRTSPLISRNSVASHTNTSFYRDSDIVTVGSSLRLLFQKKKWGGRGGNFTIFFHEKHALLCIRQSGDMPRKKRRRMASSDVMLHKKYWLVAVNIWASICFIDWCSLSMLTVFEVLAASALMFWVRSQVEH